MDSPLCKVRTSCKARSAGRGAITLRRLLKAGKTEFSQWCLCWPGALTSWIRQRYEATGIGGKIGISKGHASAASMSLHKLWHATSCMFDPPLIMQPSQWSVSPKQMLHNMVAEAACSAAESAPPGL